MTKRFGFTLAEVLITLGIIGVVAAMTIPTLIANTNSAKFRSQFKKSLSTIIPEESDNLFNIFLDAYNDDKVVKKIDEIEKRGRYL